MRWLKQHYTRNGWDNCYRDLHGAFLIAFVVWLAFSMGWGVSNG